MSGIFIHSNQLYSNGMEINNYTVHFAQH